MQTKLFIHTVTWLTFFQAISALEPQPQPKAAPTEERLKLNIASGENEKDQMRAQIPMHRRSSKHDDATALAVHGKEIRLEKKNKLEGRSRSSRPNGNSKEILRRFVQEIKAKAITAKTLAEQALQDITLVEEKLKEDKAAIASNSASTSNEISGR